MVFNATFNNISVISNYLTVTTTTYKYSCLLLKEKNKLKELNALIF
jgi:hypothetical protein